MAILPLQLARVSNLLRTNIANQTISRTQQSLLGVQNELATGKKLTSPSDDAGQAAIAQQLRKTLEQRQAFSGNLKQAGNQLSQVDSSLGELSDLLQQAQDIASSNVGSDVTPDQRENAVRRHGAARGPGQDPDHGLRKQDAQQDDEEADRRRGQLPHQATAENHDGGKILTFIRRFVDNGRDQRLCGTKTSGTKPEEPDGIYHKKR